MKAINIIIPSALLIASTLMIRYTETLQLLSALVWVASGAYLLYYIINYLTLKFKK